MDFGDSDFMDFGEGSDSDEEDPEEEEGFKKFRNDLRRNGVMNEVADWSHF